MFTRIITPCSRTSSVRTCDWGGEARDVNEGGVCERGEVEGDM